MNIVEIIFKGRAINKGGLMLFSKSDAMDFVKQCQKAQIKILGIDSFSLIGEKIQPSLANSVDYSDSDVIYDEILDFIKDQDEKFLFEIVCE